MDKMDDNIKNFSRQMNPPQKKKNNGNYRTKKYSTRVKNFSEWA